MRWRKKKKTSVAKTIGEIEVLRQKKDVQYDAVASEIIEQCHREITDKLVIENSLSDIVCIPIRMDVDLTRHKRLCKLLINRLEDEYQNKGWDVSADSFFDVYGHGIKIYFRGRK